jgi:hypothetical protein
MIYLLETSDGLKGTLVDLEEENTSGQVREFVSDVEEIRQKIKLQAEKTC